MDEFAVLDGDAHLLAEQESGVFGSVLRRRRLRIAACDCIYGWQ
jgi:hypothetical protein